MAKKDRTFVRGMSSETYTLNQFRRAQLAAPRVRDNTVVVDTGDNATHSSTSATSKVWWRVGPGDEPFLTQTIQVHFVDIDPHGANKGHGHQNEAAFYILEGKGYEIHDDKRYDWEKGDLCFVHTDSVHRHYNPYDERAVALVFKAKSLWMFMGLLQQGNSGPISRPEDFGEREEWGRIWTPGVEEMSKVVKPADGEWCYTPMGRVRDMNSPATPHRQFSMDFYEVTAPAGGRTGKYWKMADEVLYVIAGAGYSLMWEVEAEIAEKYYARVAKEPTRHEFREGDTIYVPQNTIVQHFAADGTPIHLLSGQNRVFRHLGYDNVHFFEDAPEYADRQGR
jgi:quercetin dioxygenase-like cupin family protein